MDHRREPRLSASQEVTVTVLGEPDQKLNGHLTNFSGNGLRLVLPSRITPGSAIKVEWGQTLLLGEAVYCVAEGQGFAIGMELVHALYDTAELALLARRLLQEAETGAPADVKTGVET
ncbi:MAG: PilZ domain-containing protein [Bryobacteraceae bacterium]